MRKRQKKKGSVFTCQARDKKQSKVPRSGNGHSKIKNQKKKLFGNLGKEHSKEGGVKGLLLTCYKKAGGPMGEAVRKQCKSPGARGEYEEGVLRKKLYTHQMGENRKKKLGIV